MRERERERGGGGCTAVSFSVGPADSGPCRRRGAVGPWGRGHRSGRALPSSSSSHVQQQLHYTTATASKAGQVANELGAGGGWVIHSHGVRCTLTKCGSLPTEEAKLATFAAFVSGWSLLMLQPLWPFQSWENCAEHLGLLKSGMDRCSGARKRA